MTLFRSLTPSLAPSMAFAAALVAGTSIAPLAAAHAEPAKSISVSYADLNLATDVGRATLERRIKNAAKASCGFEPSATVRLQRDYKDCVKTALSGAEQRVASIIADSVRPVAVAEARE